MNLFAISALLALGMLFPASLAFPQYGQPEGKQKVKKIKISFWNGFQGLFSPQCDRFSDCPTYGWCFDTCITNYLPANDGDVSCRVCPDHKIIFKKANLMD